MITKIFAEKSVDGRIVVKIPYEFVKTTDTIPTECGDFPVGHRVKEYTNNKLEVGYTYINCLGEYSEKATIILDIVQYKDYWISIFPKDISDLFINVGDSFSFDYMII